MDLSPDSLLTVSETAALLRVKPRTVASWVNTGKLTAVRIPSGWRISHDDIREMIDDSTIRYLKSVNES